MKLHFGYVLGLASLTLAGCAAFASVYGISQLFAGAATAVIIMASALEFGKLVAASYLQRYWKDISKMMRIYMVSGVLVLVAITSAGIYGFLSNAYQKTSDALSVNEAKVKNITLKKERYDEELLSYSVEREQLSTTINDLSKGLANNVIQYKDKETGEIITTTSVATRRALERQLKDAKGQRDKISPKMGVLRDSVTSLELQVLNLNTTNEAGAELGPLRYLSKLSGLTMDEVVNYFILLLIFVFDPLAIVLILATNWVFMQEAKKRQATYQKKTKVDVEEAIKDHPIMDDAWHKLLGGEEVKPNEALVKAQKKYVDVVNDEVEYHDYDEDVELPPIVTIEPVIEEPVKPVIEEPVKPVSQPQIDRPVVEEPVKPVAKQGILKPVTKIVTPPPAPKSETPNQDGLKVIKPRKFSKSIPIRRDNRK